MSIKKLEGGQYEVDVWPRGRNGKRIRRRFEKKQEAVLLSVMYQPTPTKRMAGRER